MEFVKLIYLILRVFFGLDFFKFSGPLCNMWVLGMYPQCMAMEKWVEGKLNKAFLQFLPYLMILKVLLAPTVCSTLKNHQIWQKKFGGKCRKSLFNPLPTPTVLHGGSKT